TGMFFNLFLPTIVGGDAVRAVLLARETGAPAGSTMSVFMERNLGLFALLTIAAAASAFAPRAEVAGLPLTALALLLLAAFVAANLVIATPSIYTLVDRLIAMSPLASARLRAAPLYEAVARYRRRGFVVVAGVILSFVFQFIVVGVVFLNARALNLDVPLSALAVFVPLISLAGMIPVTVNGLGVREALYIFFFGQLGAPTELAVSLALLFLGVTIAASLPGGLVYALDRSPSPTAPSRSAADDAAMRRS
ncbi:MAG TPA: lysylphosphatidylglycerol synthase transmembrane domain-containing protein, partial [Vicinamibacterales bacterium]|nr:lysylphosphatidylglycerol synthase transmembrane domain-containing protein [Vicinamibacterales bacterium]